MKDRMRRVDIAVREVISEALLNLKDPRVGFVTVTDVDTSPDLRHARVYVSVLGEEAEQNKTLKGLESAHGMLQRAVGQKLRLKHTPTLEFSLDSTLDQAMRIEQIINENDEHAADE